MEQATQYSPESQFDFAAMLEDSFSTMEMPMRGDVLTGTILTIDSQGLIVDVGLKRDAMIVRQDLDQISSDRQFEVGQEVPVMIISEDRDGNLVASVAQASQIEDWDNAEQLLSNSDTWEGVITEANRGGLIVPFGSLRGFVPASHVMDLPRGLTEAERHDHMNRLVGSEIAVKIIEVNRRRRRLVLSQREAQAEQRAQRKERLLDELSEGEVRKGIVSGLRDFGAFVDLGGADGLIHISELAWHRVRHPKELLSVGDEIDVYILRLDQDGKRIGLSLKRLQPNPWAQVDDMYHVGQLVEGRVSRITDFGAFISMEPGIEALLHNSQLADPPPNDPGLMVHEGQGLLMRIISIESHRQRLGLSLKEVAPEEAAEWRAQHGQPEEPEEAPAPAAEAEASPENTDDTVTDDAEALVAEAAV